MMRNSGPTSAAVILALWMIPNASALETIIEGSTSGFYNDSLQTTLDGTDPKGLFPPPGTDPVIDPAPEPDLSAASDILGEWLTSADDLNRNWSGPQSIPSFWNPTHETALVYPFTLDRTVERLVISIGVDNGAFVWLDGQYVGGHVRPGGAVLGELRLSACSLDAGDYFLQIMREDHGAGTSFAIRVVTTCLEDLNGDGSVGFDDLLILLSSWGTAATAGDVDCDGMVGFEDLLALLVAWGPCD